MIKHNFTYRATRARTRLIVPWQRHNNLFTCIFQLYLFASIMHTCWFFFWNWTGMGSKNVELIIIQIYVYSKTVHLPSEYFIWFKPVYFTQFKQINRARYTSAIIVPIVLLPFHVVKFMQFIWRSGIYEFYLKYTFLCFSLEIQSSAIITWSNLSWYYIQQCNNSGRKWIGF